MSPNTASMDHRSRVHTEVHMPIELVLARIVWFAASVVDVLLGFRFVLKLFGANAQAAFVTFIYQMSDVFMAPFNAIFNTQKIEGATFEWSVLVALAVYTLLAWGVVALIEAISPRAHAETVERVETDEDIRS